MNLEISNQHSNLTSLLSFRHITCLPYKSPYDLKSLCLNAINSGRITHSSLAISCHISREDTNLERVQKYIDFLPYWLGLSKDTKKFIADFYIDMIYVEGAFIKGIFPASLDYSKLIFYYAILQLFKAKAKPHIKGFNFTKTSKDSTYFALWLDHNSRSILNPFFYRHFQKHMFNDILSLERDLVLNSFLEGHKRFPNILYIATLNSRPFKLR